MENVLFTYNWTWTNYTVEPYDKFKNKLRDKSYSALCGRKFIWLLYKISHYLLKIILVTLEISLVAAEAEKSLLEKLFSSLY